MRADDVCMEFDPKIHAVLMQHVFLRLFERGRPPILTTPPFIAVGEPEMGVVPVAYSDLVTFLNPAVVDVHVDRLG